MPALSPTSLLSSTVQRAVITNTTQSSQAAHASSHALKVICAWPVSGQYGPGSRVLYYAVVVACIFAQRKEWLRNACLAAALLWPAVAAVHGVVLAALHVDGAVDMDIFGAFQLCAIGILAAPVTVRRSPTYFFDPGRDIIFIWGTLILAGLLSLTVEFYRSNASDCPWDDSGNPMSADPSRFPYNKNPSCNLTCDEFRGPFSPMRHGSANNIYVIPAPEKLNFGAATLLAAACCIPAILSLLGMWNQVLRYNWTRRFRVGTGDQPMNKPIEGTNGATLKDMQGVSARIQYFMGFVEIPVFGGAVLAILIVGEMNFFSHQVMYMTEPIACIGQWAPIVATGLAIAGSLYLVLKTKDEGESVEESIGPLASRCNCGHSRGEERNLGLQLQPCVGSESPPATAGADEAREFQPRTQSPTRSQQMRERDIPLFRATSSPNPTRDKLSMSRGLSDELGWTSSQSYAKLDHHRTSSSETDHGSRLKFAQTLTSIGKYLGTAAPDRFDDSEFKSGEASDFPEIPGEEFKNLNLPEIRETYNRSRDTNVNAVNAVPSLRGRRSTGGSSSGEASPSLSRSPSPAPFISRSPSPAPFMGASASRSGQLLPPQRRSLEIRTPAPSSPTSPVDGALHLDTLQVPQQAYREPMRNASASSPTSPVATVPVRQIPPAIVVSPDPEEPDPVGTYDTKPG